MTREGRIRLWSRLALAVFVIAWIFGPYEFRTLVPAWLVFLIALGLELNFFLAGVRGSGATRHTEAGPQPTDRELYGYPEGADELLLVREGGRDLWIPYAGETGEELEALIADARERPDQGPVVRERARWRLQPLLTGLGVLAALAAVVWLVDRHTGWRALGAGTHAKAEARFSAEASRIAAKPVTIRCDVSGAHVGVVQHADGVARVGGNLAYLTPERCLDLYRLAFEGRSSASQTARSLTVLAHEAWHLRGVGNEATTECFALQSGVGLGVRLGLSEGTARQMMRQQLAENRLDSGTDAEYRVSADCRDGGRLDLYPDREGFP
jgi:hypothetical protein